jgi:hypothetical protein
VDLLVFGSYLQDLDGHFLGKAAKDLPIAHPQYDQSAARENQDRSPECYEEHQVFQCVEDFLVQTDRDLDRGMTESSD